MNESSGLPARQVEQVDPRLGERRDPPVTRQRQEPRGLLPIHRPPAVRARVDRRDRPARRTDPARRRRQALRQPRRRTDPPRASGRWRSRVDHRPPVSPSQARHSADAVIDLNALGQSPRSVTTGRPIRTSLESMAADPATARATWRITAATVPCPSSRGTVVSPTTFMRGRRATTTERRCSAFVMQPTQSRRTVPNASSNKGPGEPPRSHRVREAATGLVHHARDAVPISPAKANALAVGRCRAPREAASRVR